MESNIFNSRGKGAKPPKKNKFDFKKKKENTLASLNEVEHFLNDYKHFMKYVKLYKWLKH